MHEANFTEQIVNAILEELKKYPDSKPTKVKVRVGEMLHLVPESVKAHYGHLAKGTNLEGVLLDLEEIPVKVKCRQCRREGGVQDHHLSICSFCGSPEVEILNGNEVLIDSIEMES